MFLILKSQVWVPEDSFCYDLLERHGESRLHYNLKFGNTKQYKTTSGKLINDFPKKGK